MATVREYFDLEPNDLSEHVDWTMAKGTGEPLPPVTAKLFRNFNANARYWSFFIPAGVDVRSCINAILSRPETRTGRFSLESDGLYIEEGFADYSERATTATLKFTGRIFLYVDELLSMEQRAELSLLGTAAGYHVQIRDREYVAKRAEFSKPLAFISHDSRDKDTLVRELALALTRQLCPVWYDEYSLKVGESLRAMIEKGLKEARKCILVLSPHFLANGGWGRAEFDSIFTREILERKNLVLPVWHNVEARDVYEYSPRLVDRYALNSSIGIPELAHKLALEIRREPAGSG